MDLETYSIENKVEKNHWWFKARRNLFSSILCKMQLDRNAYILDVGSSSGTNLRMLKDMGFKNYIGFDISEESKFFCESKGLGQVIVGNITQKTDFADGSFELCLLTDVIEHLDDDETALKEAGRVIGKNGKIIITVPCFKFMWGPQDIVSQHKRRYTKKNLERLLQEVGFVVEKSFYFNFLLMPLIFITRKTLLAFNKISSENNINNYFLNKLFYCIFNFDCQIGSKIGWPFGVSCLVIASKKSDV